MWKRARWERWPLPTPSRSQRRGLSRNPPFLYLFIYESLKRALLSVHCTSACSRGFTSSSWCANTGVHVSVCVCVYSITLHTCHIWWSPAQTILTSGFSNLSRIIHVTVLLFSHIHLKVICSSNCLAFHTRHRIFHKVSKKEEEIFWDSFSDSQSWVAPRLLVIYR